MRWSKKTNYDEAGFAREIGIQKIMLTPIGMAGGIYDSQSYEQIQLKKKKWPEVKIFFILDLFLAKCFRIISCKRFLYIQNAVLGDFPIK